MNIKLKYFHLLILSAIYLLGNGLVVNAQEKPNLVFIIADQLRHDVLGYAGDPKAVTPNIDKLSAQAMNFVNTVAVSPVCAPMRSSLFTGKYISSTGMVVNELRMNPNHRAIGHVLTENGYATTYIGKWHLYSNCSRHHDDECAFIPPGEHRLGFDGEWKAFNFHHENFDTYYYEDKPEKIYYGKGSYEPEEQFNMAMNSLERNANANQPFALFLSIGLPHPPWNKDNVPSEYYNMFNDVEFGLPESWSDIPDKYMDRFTDPEAWVKKWKTSIPEYKKVYYAMMASLDEYMGRLIEKLDKLGLSENTILVFTSDHGEMFGENGRIMKLTFYEGAARVPFLIRWPGKIPKNSKSEACLNTPDIMPTLLSLMNLPIPETVEGDDLSSITLGGDDPGPEFAFMQGMGHTVAWEDGSEWRSVRDKQYTYAKYLIDGSELLFDNINDPNQMNNLAYDERFKTIKNRLVKGMNNKMDELRDPFKPCTWYQGRWVDENNCIISAAKGNF